MKTSLTYGFILALLSSLLSMGFYFTGFHDTAEKVKIAHNAGMLLGIVIAIVSIYLGTKEKRALTPADTDWGYGSAFGTGFMIGLVGAVLVSLYTYCYFAFINPQMTDVLLQVELDKMAAKGMSPEQIDRAEPFVRKWMSPGIMTGFGFVFITIIHTVLALVTAAFLKNRPAATIAEPPVTA